MLSQHSKQAKISRVTMNNERNWRMIWKQWIKIYWLCKAKSERTAPMLRKRSVEHFSKVFRTSSRLSDRRNSTIGPTTTRSTTELEHLNRTFGQRQSSRARLSHTRANSSHLDAYEQFSYLDDCQSILSDGKFLSGWRLNIVFVFFILFVSLVVICSSSLLLFIALG